MQTFIPHELIDQLKKDHPIIPEYKIIRGKIGDPCSLLNSNSNEAQKLVDDIKRFVNL